VNLARNQLLTHAALSLDQNGEISSSNALDPGAQGGHHRRRSDERRRSITPRSRRKRQRAAVRLRPAAIDLQDQRGDFGRDFESLAFPLVKLSALFEGHREGAPASGYGPGDVEGK